MFLHLKQKNGLTLWLSGFYLLLSPPVNSPAVLASAIPLWKQMPWYNYMHRKASAIILLALFFFTFIDCPFALCVNFNSCEGISMMRENKIFEYNCQNKSQPSTCRHGFFTGFKLLQKWQYSYHRIPFLKIYLKNNELEIKCKYECCPFRNSTFASLGCDWGADRTQQWVQTEQRQPQEPPVQHYPAPTPTHMEPYSPLCAAALM